MSNDSNADRQVTTHYDRERLPAVNIKVPWFDDYDSLLPLALGSVARQGPDGTWGEPEEVTSDPRFTWAWVLRNTTEEQRNHWLRDVCEEYFQDAKELAYEEFGRHVKVWQEGRSGGWLTVEGLGDYEEWTTEQRDRWFGFADQVTAMVADVHRGFLWALYTNVFEEFEEPFGAHVTVCVTIEPEAYHLAYDDPEATHDKMRAEAATLIAHAAAAGTLPEWLSVTVE